jgi:hypothetical protein
VKGWSTRGQIQGEGVGGRNNERTGKGAERRERATGGRVEGVAEEREKKSGEGGKREWTRGWRERWNARERQGDRGRIKRNGEERRQKCEWSKVK